MGSVMEKLSVEVNHTEESLKSRFIRGRRKISNGVGALWERVETGTGEAMAQELGLGDGELTFAQANCQAMDTAQLQVVLEMLNMRSTSSVGRYCRRFGVQRRGIGTQHSKGVMIAILGTSLEAMGI